MGKKDIVDRPYFSDCERFAELMNVALYHGEQILRPENLILQSRKYLSLSSAYGEMERDVLMKDVRHNMYYGIEIETESDYGMPQRVMTYDTCEYEYQIKELDKEHRSKKNYRSYRERKSRMKESDFLLPMVTVVLYVKEGHWEGRRRLSQMFRAEARELLGGKLHDFVFPLIEADYVNPADYSTDLKEFESLVHKMEKEDLPMCKAFDDLMREERQEGKKEGKREEKIRIIRQMIGEGLDEAFIRRITKCTKEEYTDASRPAC